MLIPLLFESTAKLLVTLVVIDFGLICLWSWRRSDLTRRTVWIGLAALPLMLILSHQVVTTRERIMALCKRLADAVEEGDVPFIMRHLDAKFRLDEMDRDAVSTRLTATLSRVRVSDIQLSAFDIILTDDHRATASFRSTCHVRAEEVPYEWLLFAWKLTLRAAGESWIIERIDSVPVPPLNIKHWRQLLR